MRRATALVAVLLAGCAAGTHHATPQPAPPTTMPTVATSTTTAPARHLPSPTVTAIGDSVMIDATSALRAVLPNVDIDAATDRSALPAPGILSSLAAARRLGSEIVMALGLNGGVSEGVLNEVLSIANGRRVVMVTSHCPYCSWTPRGNAIIHSTCVPSRRCVIADWDALARGHPEWFGRDGVHMPPGAAGAQAYARLLRSKLE